MRTTTSRGLTVFRFSVTKFAGKQHYHGCTTCKCKYLCGCETPETDVLCNDCRTGRETFLQVGYKPKPCCTERRLATPKERDSYKLAGPGPWFFCRTCMRSYTTPGSTA